MFLLLIGVASPILMLVVAAVVLVVAKIIRRPVANVGHLVGLSIALAAAGAFITLVLTIVWMILYENITGYSAGNGPLGWIFFYGPLGAALGQLLALVLWWRTNVRKKADDIT